MSLLLAAPLAFAVGIWWEGESTLRTNFPRPVPEAGVGAQVLSESTWLYTGPWEGETRFATYEVEVPESGSFHLYARKFWKHGPYRWRFGEGSWQEVTRRVALLDTEVIRTHMPANWTHAGQAELTKGRHLLQIELTDPDSPAAFDAFYLTDEPFFPQGKLRPSEPWPEAEQGWFVATQQETLLDPSPIDLSYLNESSAGERGWIRREGAQFVQQGKPIRLMGVGAGKATIALPRHMIDLEAKFLARHGVNLVRFHGGPFAPSGPNAGEIDEELLDNLFYFIAAMKREGIYTHLSIYFQHWFAPSELESLPGYEPGQLPFALHFFNEQWQAMYRHWWDAILTRENPYTETHLADDPCLFGLELLNEDSLFFWTFSADRIPEPQMAILEQQFGDWLIKRYGRLEAVIEDWGKRLDRDDPKSGRIAFGPLFSLFSSPGQRERDTARFLAETQRAFFDTHYRYVKEELGYGGLVMASNWRTANTRFLGAIDKWTNAGTDFFDHHGYFASWRKKMTAAFNFSPGDLVADRALARWDSRSPTGEPQRLEMPFLSAQIDNQPQMVSEFAWPNHNRYRAEMPLIAYSLAAQAGIDAMVLFTLRDEVGWSSSVDSHHWPVPTPAELGQFPAAAFTYRQGLVRESEPVATVKINVDEMLDLQGSDFTDPSSSDYNRAQEGRDESVQGIDMRHFAAGKVAVEFTRDGPTATLRTDLGAFDNPETKRLVSATSEIDWRYGDGLFLLTTPQSQGVTGFLMQAGTVHLPDATVSVDNDFATVWLVALDGEPIHTSSRMLLQVMSEQRNRGYRTEGEPQREIIANGGPPVEVRHLRGRVELRREDAAELSVTPLDINGVPGEPTTGAASIELQPEVLYYLIERP